MNEEEQRNLDVMIMGRSYTVSCRASEREALLRAVAYLDHKMNEIRASGRVTQPERIAVMAALNITHELLSTKLGGNFDFGTFKRRIDDMQSILDEVLKPQDGM